MTFNVDNQGTTNRAEDAPSDLFTRIQAVAEELAQIEVENRTAEVEKKLEEWDGTLNADDVKNLMTALQWAAEHAAQVGQTVMAAVDFADLQNVQDTLQVVASSKIVITDAMLLSAKLQRVLLTHPHTLSITPF